MPNAEQLAEIDRLIDWAEASDIADDGEWVQADFAQVSDHACGTAYCIAGKWAVEHGWTHDCVTGYWAPPNDNPSFATLGPGVAAAKGLGIPEMSMGDTYEGHLFSVTNTVDDLRRHAKALREEAGL